MTSRKVVDWKPSARSISIGSVPLPMTLFLTRNPGLCSFLVGCDVVHLVTAPGGELFRALGALRLR